MPNDEPTGTAFDMDIAAIKAALDTAPDCKALQPMIVNEPFKQRLAVAQLFLGIIVFLLVDKESDTINRVALSNTELAKNTTDVSFLPFEEIRIPLDDPENIIARTVATGEMHDTTDWFYMFTPALSGEQARINQASGGIAYSAVYPINYAEGGAMIFSYYQYEHNIGAAQRKFMAEYTELVGEVLTERAARNQQS